MIGYIEIIISVNDENDGRPLKLSSKSILRKFVHWALGVYYYLKGRTGGLKCTIPILIEAYNF